MKENALVKYSIKKAIKAFRADPSRYLTERDLDAELYFIIRRAIQSQGLSHRLAVHLDLGNQAEGGMKRTRSDVSIIRSNRVKPQRNGKWEWTIDENGVIIDFELKRSRSKNDRVLTKIGNDLKKFKGGYEGVVIFFDGHSSERSTQIQLKALKGKYGAVLGGTSDSDSAVVYYVPSVGQEVLVWPEDHALAVDCGLFGT